jgi:hypothetical protein
MRSRIRVLAAVLIAFIGLAGLMQGAGAQVVTGTVNVQKYYCTYLDTTLLVEAIDEAECDPGAATFTFYLVGDGTADYEQLTVGANGAGTIDLPVGAYEMVEEGSQTFFNINVLEGETVQLLIGNPAVVVQPTVPPVPGPTQPPQLPNTGAGEADGIGLTPLVLVAAAAIAGGGALTMRKHQPH